MNRHEASVLALVFFLLYPQDRYQPLNRPRNGVSFDVNKKEQTLAAG